MTPSIWFLLLTFGAFALMVLEIFIPGGFLGALGAASLVGACVFAFIVFGPTTGALISVLLVIFTLAALFAWILLLPKTRIGKRISLSNDLAESKATEDRDELIGLTGTAETDLRPSGFARVNGQRLDVVARHGYIETGSAIEIVEVHGMRIVVEPLLEAPEPDPA